jgi:hypothetical protein
METTYKNIKVVYDEEKSTTSATVLLKDGQKIEVATKSGLIADVLPEIEKVVLHKLLELYSRQPLKIAE